MLRAVLVFLLASLAAPAIAADMAVAPPVDSVPVSVQTPRDYVEGRALLHLIRATFDVEPLASVKDLVAADAADAIANGVTEQQTRQLQTELVTEGGYFLISLRYLIDAGFPNWPEARSATSYERDARMLLEPLPEQLLATVLANEDPIAIFDTAGQVYWWTEGADESLDGRADFSQRDALVDAAFEAPASAPDQTAL